MRTNNLGNVAVSVAKYKKTKLPWTHDVNTTADFGDVSPIQCKGCFPDSSHKVSTESLIWLAPIVSPVFGRVSWKTWHYFVRMSDLTRNFAAFMSQTAVTRANSSEFVPMSAPKMNVATLSLMVLYGARLTIWEGQPTLANPNWTPDNGDQPNGGNFVHYELYKYYNGNSVNSAVHAILDSLKFYSVNAIDRHIDFYQDARIFNGYKGAKLDLGALLGPDVGGGGVNRVMIPLANPTARSLFYHNDPSSTLWTSHGDIDSYVTPKKADEVITVTLQDSANVKHHLAFCFRLSNIGKRLKKVIEGLGYQVDFTSTEEVQIFKLFAYYKAYFDTFGLLLYENWENTAACKLLNEYDQDNFYDFGQVFRFYANTDNSDAARRANLWQRFVEDLAFTYVTDPQDYVSAHTRTIGVAAQPFQNESLGQFVSTNGTNSSPAIASGAHLSIPAGNGDSTQMSVNQHAFINNVFHGQLDAKLLQKLYRVTNVNTIAGKRVRELCLLNGLGDFMDKVKPNFIGSDSAPINFGSLTSQSDTYKKGADGIEEGSLLGERGGQGMGYNEGKTFEYSHDEPGFYIIFAAMVPETGYCQGIDEDCKCIKKHDFYHPVYDALGMSATKKSSIVGRIDWASPQKQRNKLTETFGFITRYAGLKVVKNVMTGDFSLRGKRDAYATFTLDKLILLAERYCEENVVENDNSVAMVSNCSPLILPEDLAVAGNIWRFISKYPYLSRYRRIFANTGKIDGYIGTTTVLFEDESLVDIGKYWEYIANYYDNFVCQNIIHHDCKARVLPISESFETLDDGNEGTIDKNISKA